MKPAGKKRTAWRKPMIWGETEKSRNSEYERKRGLVEWHNRGLLSWHNFFAWRKVELLDGRFARICFVERKFVLYDSLPNARQNVLNGTLDIKDCDKNHDRIGANVFGFYAYRISGQHDDVGDAVGDADVGDASEDEYTAGRLKGRYATFDDMLAAQDAASESYTLTPKNGRREAVLAQKARSK
jgi:hypothetical protein